MGEVFNLPQLSCTLTTGKLSLGRPSLAVAGGRPPLPGYLAAVARLNPGSTLYCADRGADYALAAGLVPRLLVGDGDSGSQAVYLRCTALGTEVEAHPPLKDATDLQLLLQRLPPAPLLLSGIWGGRFDHLYSALFSLLAWQARQDSPVLLADQEEVMLLARGGEGWRFAIKEGSKVEALSLLPLSKTARVTLAGTYWPLAAARLRQLEPYAISNVLAAGSSSFTVDCMTGSLGIYVKFSGEKAG